jgi:hypothetical protein
MIYISALQLNDWMDLYVLVIFHHGVYERKAICYFWN